MQKEISNERKIIMKGVFWLLNILFLNKRNWLYFFMAISTIQAKVSFTIILVYEVGEQF